MASLASSGRGHPGRPRSTAWEKTLADDASSVSGLVREGLMSKALAVLLRRSAVLVGPEVRAAYAPPCSRRALCWEGPETWGGLGGRRALEDEALPSELRAWP